MSDATTQRTDAGSTEGTTDMRALEARMPESIKQDFVEGFGSTFACPECGAPSTGTCENCGHTHARLREDPDGGR